MFASFFATFGISGIILSLCVFTVLVISIERLYFFFIEYSVKNGDAFLAMLLEILENIKTKPLNIREIHISQEIDRIEQILGKGVNLIRFISAVAPMIGLFGTVLGIISIFGSIADSNSPITPALIADGLHEALYATAIGLFIAITAMGISVFFHHIINERIQRYIYIMNEENIRIDYEVDDKKQA
jgi:biopolymer transport protein ExbB/TolQ